MIENNKNNNVIDDDFDFEGKREETTFLIHASAGSIAGLMEHVAIYPIDTIKTHIQTAKQSLTVSETFFGLYQQGGLQRFWKGSSVIGSACVPAHALYFSVYEFSKKGLGVDQAGFQFVGSAITGALATFFHDLIITPADMVKQRIQLSGSNKCLDCAKSILKTEGLYSFYRSLPITLIMNAPYAITTVMVNENIKKIVEPKKRKYKFLSYYLCAAMAGSLASVITCPMDNIKTKLQTQNITSSCEKLNSKFREPSLTTNIVSVNQSRYYDINKYHNNSIQKTDCHADSNIKYRSVLSTMNFIWNENGFKGFFKGLTPRIFTNAPSCAISWGTYEFIKHVMTKKTNK